MNLVITLLNLRNRYGVMKIWVFAGSDVMILRGAGCEVITMY